MGSTSVDANVDALDIEDINVLSSVRINQLSQRQLNDSINLNLLSNLASTGILFHFRNPDIDRIVSLNCDYVDGCCVKNLLISSTTPCRISYLVNGKEKFSWEANSPCPISILPSGAFSAYTTQRLEFLDKNNVEVPIEELTFSYDIVRIPKHLVYVFLKVVLYFCDTFCSQYGILEMKNEGNRRPGTVQLSCLPYREEVIVENGIFLTLMGYDVVKTCQNMPHSYRYNPEEEVDGFAFYSCPPQKYIDVKKDKMKEIEEYLETTNSFIREAKLLKKRLDPTPQAIQDAQERLNKQLQNYKELTRN